jgi:glucose-1-phosphate cytidylyltransferase
MKVVILAGGYGTRFGKLTDFIPKPMIPVGSMPIVWHIMRYYAAFGHNEFILATGYKAEMIKEFFSNLNLLSSDFTVDYGGSGQMEFHSRLDEFRPKVTVAYTGQDTMTGGRVKRIEKYLGSDDSFFLTYGDGLSNIDLDALLKFHRNHGKLGTLTAVYPPPRFGDLKFDGDRIVEFSEKQGTKGAMVNGGFYVFQRQALEYLSEDRSCILEKKPLEQMAHHGQLMGFRHEGYWQCMDTTRDLESLQQSWIDGKAPWKVWKDGQAD